MQNTVIPLSVFETAHYFQGFMESNNLPSMSDQWYVYYSQNRPCHIRLFLFPSWKDFGEGNCDLKCNPGRLNFLKPWWASISSCRTAVCTEGNWGRRAKVKMDMGNVMDYVPGMGTCVPLNLRPFLVMNTRVNFVISMCAFTSMAPLTWWCASQKKVAVGPVLTPHPPNSSRNASP